MNCQKTERKPLFRLEVQDPVLYTSLEAVGTLTKKIFILFLIFISPKLWAADPFINVLGGSAPVKDGFYFSSEGSPTQGTPTSPGIFENRFRAVALISKNEPDTWGLQGTLGSFIFGSPVTLYDPANINPPLLLNQIFWEVEVGGTYRHNYSRGRALSINASVGSASDYPFASLNESIFQATSTYRLPTDMNHAWIFFLNWSNNRSFLNYIPLPGAAYFLKSSDNRFTATLGFPILSATYEIAPGLNAKASVAGIIAANAELNEQVFSSFRVYAAYDWGQRLWLPTNRSDPLNRLILDQMKASVGLRTPQESPLFADLSFGYYFNRQIFEAYSYLASRAYTQNIDADWTAQLMFGFRGATVR